MNPYMIEAPDSTDIDGLGNIHFGIPRDTYFVAKLEGVWCGKLVDEGGPHDTDLYEVPDIYNQAVRWEDAFRLVFKDEAMLQDFLNDDTPDLAPMQEFVRGSHFLRPCAGSSPAR